MDSKKWVAMMKRISVFVVLFTFLIYSSSCSSGDKSDRAVLSDKMVVHPTQSAFLNESDVDAIIHTESQANLLSVKDQKLKLVIGDDEGKMENMIGSIESAGIIMDTILVVADDQQYAARLYDLHTGNYESTLAKRGRGPGEFMDLSDLSVSGARIIMIDRRIQKVEIFEQEELQEFGNRSFKLDFSPHFFCELDGKIFISGFHYDKSQTIHVYSVDSGSYLFSFHEEYPSESFMVSLMLSNNRVACNQNTGKVAVISPYLPYVYGYDSTGTLQWTSKLDVFNPVEVIEGQDSNGNPTITKSIRDDGVTDIFSQFLAVDSGSEFILQMNRMEKQDGETKEAHILTFMLDANDGSAKLVSTDLPIIQDVSDRYLIFSTYEPHPQIALYENFLEE